MQALKIEKLYLKHGGFLLRDFNMELEVGQIHVITGKSGSGKSTGSRTHFVLWKRNVRG